ncbi:MAG TPA: efflux RND transporter periplasmic adaptor subunit, partial [Micropepsaceae bacterium]|nr:efflux RND transporter periplasmic adaptor subunit [Micropepsaceae bacterium]
ATAARDAARGRVRALEARLGDRVIRAPFAGVLGLRMVSPGELVRPGDPIVTLDDVSVIKADFPVPERYVPLLRNGLQIEAFASAWPERGFSGTVTSVSTRVDVATRSVTVRAEIPNPEGLLRPGMLLAITLTTENRTALAVPETAIVPVGDVRYVFVIGEDLKAARVEVRTGNRYAGFVEILSGIEAGAVVVSEGTHKVIPGLAVQLPAAADAASGGAGSGGGGAP